MPVYEEYGAPRRGPPTGDGRHALAQYDCPRGPPPEVSPWLAAVLCRAGAGCHGREPGSPGRLMLQANEVLKRLGGRWMLQSEAQRQRVTTLPRWPGPRRS